MPPGVFNFKHLLIVFALPGIEVIPNLLLQELSVSNGLMIWFDHYPLARVREVGVVSLHAECCVQGLNQSVKVGLGEEWDPGKNQVTPYSTA